MALKPDALHAFSTPAVAALLQTTQTIPVVCGVTDQIAPRTSRVAALFNLVTAPYATKFYIAALENAGLALAIQITAASALRPDPATRGLNRPYDLSELMSRTIAP